MPVYEYECKACGRDFEYQQRMSDPDKTTCEACGGALDRLISRTAFSLKGGGWYKDLYASPKPEKSDKTDKTDKATGTADGGQSGKSDGAAATAAKPDGGSTAGGSGTGTPGGGSGTGSGGSSSTSAAAAKAS
jgi:putative FmdB family regulatory protein